MISNQNFSYANIKIPIVTPSCFIDTADCVGFVVNILRPFPTEPPVARGRTAERRPSAGRNLALLTCRAFLSREPVARQTWRIHLGPYGVRAVCDFPDARLGFDRRAFGGDPRIARMKWLR